MEDSNYLQNREDERIMLVDNHPCTIANWVEVMRSAGMQLNKIQHRSDLRSALTLFEQNSRAIKVFIVDFDLLQDYAKSRNENLSCFVRAVEQIAERSNNMLGSDIIFVLTSDRDYH